MALKDYLQVPNPYSPRTHLLIAGLCASTPWEGGLLSDAFDSISHEMDFGEYGGCVECGIHRKAVDSVIDVLNYLYPFLEVKKAGGGYLEITFPDSLESKRFLESERFLPQNVPFNDVSIPVSSRKTIVVVANNSIPPTPFTPLGNIPYYTISKALELFNFPPNHPTESASYTMIDLFPDVYVPTSSFHEYYKQRKHQAFLELCANLGAKEIDIASVEINDRSLDIKGDIAGPLSSLGLGINAHESSKTGMKIAFRFSEGNKGIKNYDSPWLQTEPSWLAMNNMRRQNHLSEIGAEFNCTDNMGIDANLAAKFSNVGINIGGSFTEMTKIRLSYHVVFWDL
jgi:hypothetical protein